MNNDNNMIPKIVNNNNNKPISNSDNSKENYNSNKPLNINFNFTDNNQNNNNNNMNNNNNNMNNNFNNGNNNNNNSNQNQNNNNNNFNNNNSNLNNNMNNNMNNNNNNMNKNFNNGNNNNNNMNNNFNNSNQNNNINNNFNNGNNNNNNSNQNNNNYNNNMNNNINNFNNGYNNQINMNNNNINNNFNNGNNYNQNNNMNNIQSNNNLTNSIGNNNYYSESDEVCAKCGKHLPYGSKYCLFCGWSKEQEYSGENDIGNNNKHIFLGFLPTPIRKISCIVLCVIIIFGCFLYLNNYINNDNYFKYHFNNKAEDILYIDNDNFFINNNGKIKYYGSDYLSVYYDIKDLNVREMGFNGSSSSGFYIYTKDNDLYEVVILLGSGYVEKKNSEKIEASNIYEAYNKLNKYGNNTDYYNDYDVIFYKDKNVYKKDIYSNSNIILDSNSLNITEPTLLYQSNNVILLKDTNRIIYIDDGVVKNSNELEINNTKVDLNDMKYVFGNNSNILLVDKNNRTYNFDIKRGVNNTVEYSYNGSGIKSILDIASLIDIFRILYALYKIKFIVIVAFILFDLFFIYSIRNGFFIKKVLAFTGLFTIEYLITYFMINVGTDTKKLPTFFGFLMMILLVASVASFVSAIVVQLQEIVLKLESFIDMENILSFYILLITTVIAIFTITFSVTYLIDFAFLYTYVIGLIWFLYVNDEIKVFNDTNKGIKTYIIIAICILLVIISSILFSKSLFINNHLLFIIFMSLILGGYFATKEKVSLFRLIKCFTLPVSLMILFKIVVYIISLLVLSSVFTEILKLLGIYILKYVVIIIVIFSIFSLISYLVYLIFSNIIKLLSIENSYIKMFLYATIYVFLISLLLYNYADVILFINTFLDTDLSSDSINQATTGINLIKFKLQ